ncbi:MAG: thioredoxin domain-containing protein, partial [Acidobacteriota bacterium]|nr:thioredoxin domain-containing protein [Acidobacteriota bacterium]
MRILAALLVLAWLPASSAIAQKKPKSALDKSALEAYLRHVELYRGTVTYKIDDPRPSKDLPGFSEVEVHLSFDGGTKDERYYVSKDGQILVNGDVYRINGNPFQTNLDRLSLADLPSLGPANAPVTIVEFGDLECPDCRMEAPILRHNVRETFASQVRLYFKDFPLGSIHPWARAAAIAGRCVYHQDAKAFWDFYDWIYENQQEIDPDNLNSKILAWAGQNGLDAGRLGRCIETKASEPEVDRSLAEGRSLGVRGTPTLFINGRKIGGLAWPDLELVIRK